MRLRVAVVKTNRRRRCQRAKRRRSCAQSKRHSEISSRNCKSGRDADSKRVCDVQQAQQSQLTDNVDSERLRSEQPDRGRSQIRRHRHQARFARHRMQDATVRDANTPSNWGSVSELRT